MKKRRSLRILKERERERENATHTWVQRGRSANGGDECRRRRLRSERIGSEIRSQRTIQTLGLKIRSLSLQLQGFLQYRNHPNRSIIMNRTEPVKKYQYIDTHFKLRFVLVLFRLVVYNGERELRVLLHSLHRELVEEKWLLLLLRLLFIESQISRIISPLLKPTTRFLYQKKDPPFFFLLNFVFYSLLVWSWFDFQLKLDLKQLRSLVKISPQVSEAISSGRAVVALESTIISHGLD